MVQYGAIDHVPQYNLSRGVVLFSLIAPLVSYLLCLTLGTVIGCGLLQDDQMCTYLHR